MKSSLFRAQRHFSARLRQPPVRPEPSTPQPGRGGAGERQAVAGSVEHLAPLRLPLASHRQAQSEKRKPLGEKLRENGVGLSQMPLDVVKNFRQNGGRLVRPRHPVCWLFEEKPPIRQRKKGGQLVCSFFQLSNEGKQLGSACFQLVSKEKNTGSAESCFRKKESGGTLALWGPAWQALELL